jgi:hypothetical protein
MRRRVKELGLGNYVEFKGRWSTRRCYKTHVGIESYDKRLSQGE